MDDVLTFIYNSKKGRSRERNQDRIMIIYHKGFYLFALFDGVSSFPFSYAFAETFKRRIKANIDIVDGHGNNLDILFYKINKDVSKLKINGKSTISVLFYNMTEGIAKFINIGDTRIYMYNNQFLEQLTVDDSLNGNENIVTKCLGYDSLIIDDFKPKIIENQNNFLICTDGFYKLMEKELKEYFTTLNFKNPLNIKKKIANLQRGKNQDDSSYILIKNEF
jgi:serine/threonine protein phosphatase PrpC